MGERKCRKCGVPLNSVEGGNWSPSGVAKYDYICKQCVSVRNAKKRKLNGGFPSATVKSMFEEDQWLYQCYAMLGNTGLAKDEKNARWLADKVLSFDRTCPCCGVAMVTTAGEGTGKGSAGQPRARPDSPSIEHVLPKTHPDYNKHDEKDLLRIICLKCNKVLMNSTPREMYDCADWRHEELKHLGYDNDLKRRGEVNEVLGNGHRSKRSGRRGPNLDNQHDGMHAEGRGTPEHRSDGVILRRHLNLWD